MAYIEPKVNWNDADVVINSDLNRIEGNTKVNHDAIITEEAARIAHVNAEEAARISVDTTLQGNINTLSSALSTEQSVRESGDNANTAALDLLRPESAKIGAHNGSGDVVLPSGGTYMYFGFYDRPDHGGMPKYNSITGVASGGTTIYTGAPNYYQHCVIYWKIS
jgi:hypothetical protein